MVRTEAAAAATAAAAVATAGGCMDIDQIRPDRSVWVEEEAKPGRTKLDN